MASLSSDKTSIQFVGWDRKRKTIRLTKQRLTKTDAEKIKRLVEALNSAVISNHGIPSATNWDSETAGRVKGLGVALYDKLQRVGLVPKRTAQIDAEAKVAAEQAAEAEAAKLAALPRLGAFLDSYIASRTDVGPGTKLVYEQVQRCLVDFFTAEKLLGEITIAEAGDWRRWLGDKAKGEKLAPNTVRKRCQVAKQFFQDAIDRELIERNPFGKMKGNTVKGNPERQRIIDRATAEKVLESCPDNQWKLIFALSRYGGLRCPSEHLRLTWGDVNWDRSTMHVQSPKTARHEGKASRIVPIFAELRPYLQAVYDELLADEGFDPKATRMSDLPIITRYRESNSNLRTQLLRILKRAGVKAWPRLFHNLRATRQTELAESFPMHVVCEWIGNSEAVAKEHYLQVTDAHYAAACGAVDAAILESAALGDAAGSGNKAQVGSNSPKRQITASGRSATTAGSFRQLPDIADYCTDDKLVREGFEPPTKGL